MREGSLIERDNSLVKLLRFLSGYGLAIAVLLYALPVLAAQAEAIYESMNSALRFCVVVLFAAAVGGWHFFAQRRTKTQ